MPGPVKVLKRTQRRSTVGAEISTSGHSLYYTVTEVVAVSKASASSTCMQVTQLPQEWGGLHTQTAKDNKREMPIRRTRSWSRSRQYQNCQSSWSGRLGMSWTEKTLQDRQNTAQDALLRQFRHESCRRIWHLADNTVHRLDGCTSLQRTRGRMQQLAIRAIAQAKACKTEWKIQSRLTAWKATTQFGRWTIREGVKRAASLLPPAIEA